MTIAIIWASVIAVAVIGGIIASTRAQIKKKFIVYSLDFDFIKANPHIEHDLFCREKEGKEIVEKQLFFVVCTSIGYGVICQPVRYKANTGMLTFKVATDDKNQFINRD